jgi:glycosyltransferase involved in cell wall biosynthesis
MRIGIDARELVGHPTGVGRYLNGLLRHWIADGPRPAHEFLLYAHRPIDVPTGGPVVVRVLPGAGGTLWEQRTLASAIEADRIDVLFSPAYSTPLFTAVPRVVALHDISFAARPEWYSKREGMRRRVLAKRGAAAAMRIVTISDFSRAELVARFGIDPARIAVIPPGVDPPVSGTADDDGAEGTNETSVLYVGSIFNRRHVPDLIAAFTAVAGRHPDAALHLVGDNRSFPKQDIEPLIAASAAAPRIAWHRYVTDEELRRLYRQARAFAFLSEYEGLGLTPLEALASGIPSLLLDTPVARESCGIAAHYTSLGNPEAIASDLERVVYDEPLRRALLTAAPATLARYDWPRAAAQTLQVLVESAG